MLPSVNIRYNRRNYQPNIYCIVVASSGANKNLIGYGIRLHKHYCEYWEKQSLKIEKEYKKALRDYTLSLQAARKRILPPLTCRTNRRNRSWHFRLSLPTSAGRSSSLTSSTTKVVLPCSPVPKPAASAQPATKITGTSTTSSARHSSTS